MTKAKELLDMMKEEVITLPSESDLAAYVASCKKDGIGQATVADIAAKFPTLDKSYYNLVVHGIKYGTDSVEWKSLLKEVSVADIEKNKARL